MVVVVVLGDADHVAAILATALNGLGPVLQRRGLAAAGARHRARAAPRLSAGADGARRAAGGPAGRNRAAASARCARTRLTAAPGLVACPSGAAARPARAPARCDRPARLSAGAGRSARRAGG